MDSLPGEQSVEPGTFTANGMAFICDAKSTAKCYAATLPFADAECVSTQVNGRRRSSPVPVR